MRTQNELEAQARQLEQRGRELWTVHRENQEPLTATWPQVRGVATLFTFPESIVTLRPSSARDTTEVHRMVRRIEFVPETHEPFFAFVEEEFVTDANGERLRYYEPMVLVVTNRALEALIAGYQRSDEDRLRELLEPIAERIEMENGDAPATAEAIAEVEGVADGLIFSPAARMRLRVDAIAFLEGRLEAGDFIARTVERQQWFEPTMTMSRAEQITEGIAGA